MFYVVAFDFSLIGLLLAVFGFLVWCWIGFRQARKPQTVDQSGMTTVPKTKQRAEERVA